MDHLILVKHSLPEVVPGRPAHQWLLNDEGRRRCQPLAEKLAPYQPTMIIASQEPKAAETARLAANHLDLPWEIAAGLHEHERANAPFLGREKFEAIVADFFARPDELVFGDETAAAARLRFTRAVQQALERTPAGTLAVVTHGTVLTLFVAAHNAVEPFPLWQQLDLPSFVVLSRPSLALVEVVPSIE
ncbi:MAG: phosphoglycerate mutase family protein [Chloroflexi bacterium]|nr:phosphoglycerate mutase family protein [Chloroflexota bacterium]MCI0579792.1 phosphoglycerate mutase family protein [Chloroflexota bacterium]MCI0648604.1 phosphoglycerate mutase family protein [Chloroflexota bacterium]MCI0725451.1 phosphoglycerate mutase family protein [Chloroflexota bacterium]